MHIQHNPTSPDLQTCIELVSAIADPEIPVITIAELGILRGVNEREGGTLEVQITPTYSGCPAMQMIRDLIVETLNQAGIRSVVVNLVLSPAWSTDWITDVGRRKMKDYGIAPPAKRQPQKAASLNFVAPNEKASDVKVESIDGLKQALFTETKVACPRCDSQNTRLVSAFGSTACQEQWRCLSCHEPFDHFKCH